MSQPSIRRSSASPAANPEPETRSHRRGVSVVICVLLVLAVWAVFGRTLGYQFVNYDDDIYVYENPNVTQGLSLPGCIRAFTRNNGPDEWYPLTGISHMLDWQLFGSNAGGHHLTNVLLHTASVVLLFLALQNMTRATWRSAFVAAVFAIHPLRVQSVAWVTERKDVLSGAFFMLTLLGYAKAVTRDRWPVTRTDDPARTPVVPLATSPFYYLALISFALSLLAKTTPVTLPAVLLLLDYWPLGRMAGAQRRVTRFQIPIPRASTFNRLLLEKVPFLLLSGAAGTMSLLTQKGALSVVHDVGLPWRAGNALLGYGVYLERMFYPANLALLYPHPAQHLPLESVVASALVLLIISAVAIAGLAKHPYLAVGWFWYLLMLLPVIDIMQAGDQARADRYTYLPQIGLYILIAWGAAEFTRSWRHRRVALGGAAALVLAGLMAAAGAQTAYWRNSVSLWTRTLACTPESPIAHCNLGIALAGEGRLDAAARQFQQALQLNPRDTKSLDNAGKVLMARDKFDEAIRDFDRALQIDPNDVKAMDNLGVALADEGKPEAAIRDFEQALEREPDDARVHYNLGNVLVAQGKLAEAQQHYESCLQFNPGFAEAHCNLGLVLARQGRLDAAIRHYQQALRLKPDYAPARDNLAAVLAARQKMGQAAQYYEQVLQLSPDNADAHNNLGVVLARQGQLDEAIRHFQRALAIKPDDASAHNNLALALAGEGKSDEARRQFQEALDLARMQNNDALADSILKRLQSLPPAASRPQEP